MKNLANNTISRSQRCRILYIIGQLGWGGSERQLSYLLRSIDREQYPSRVLVWNYSPHDRYVEEIRSLGIPIHSFPQGTSKITKLCGVRRLSRLLSAEVIHSFSFYTNFPAHWATLKSNAVALGSLRGEFAQAKKDNGPLFGRLNARWPRYQICNSASAAEAMRGASGAWSPAQVRVVRNGIDLERFAYTSLNGGVKASILGIGSLQSLKRWDRVLRIFQNVRAHGYDCRLTIAGEGPERVALEQQSRGFGLAGYTEFIGATSDVSDLLRQSRLLVHASETEGCPNAVMEAMACGRPVVAMEAGDIPLLVDDGKNGFVIQRGDEEKFGLRIMQLLADDELCLRMGKAAREKAEREFGLGRLMAETMAAYRAAGWQE